MKVTDVNNVESYYKTTRIENLTTPDDVINFKNAPSLIINEVKGWDHYDTKKLSKGGRIYNRSEKSLLYKNSVNLFSTTSALGNCPNNK